MNNSFKSITKEQRLISKGGAPKGGEVQNKGPSRVPKQAKVKAQQLVSINERQAASPSVIPKLTAHCAVNGVTPEKIEYAERMIEEAYSKIQGMYKMREEELDHMLETAGIEEVVRQRLTSEMDSSAYWAPIIERLKANLKAEEWEKEEIVEFKKTLILRKRQLVLWKQLLEWLAKTPKETILAFMVKESHLEIGVKKGGSGVGLCQLTTIGINGINQRFGTEFTINDVYDKSGEAENQEEISTNNVIGGILLWLYGREVNLKEIGIETKDEEEKNLFADFIYNIGIGKFERLWKLLKPKNFDDLELKISEAMHKQKKSGVALRSDPDDLKEYSSQYAVKYRCHHQIIDKANVRSSITMIEGEKFDTAKLIEGIRHARITAEIRAKRYV